MINGFVQDLHHATRALQKAPLASAVAVLALALGIGVNVSAFIAVNGIILHPLPYAHLERIQTIWESSADRRVERTGVATANFLDLADKTRSFQYLAACRSAADTLRNDATSDMVRVAQVTGSFFDVLSGQAQLGRNALNDRNAVVISEAFWKTRLAGSRDVVGRQVL